jgi:hypothetical protein
MIFSENDYYVELFRNLNGLFTSLFTTYTLYDYTFNDNNVLLNNNIAVIVTNLLVDSVMTNSPLILLHHAISVGYYVVFYTHSLEIKEMKKSATILFSTEISSIFLCVRELLILHPDMKNKMNLIYNINDICFVCSFFYFRVYLLPSYVFFDPEFFLSSYITSEYSFYILSYALTGLNIYWAGLISYYLVQHLL